MNIYLVGPIDCTYDEYDAFVVAAVSESGARYIAYEATGSTPTYRQKAFKSAPVKLIGVADEGVEAGVVLGSFCAG